MTKKRFRLTKAEKSCLERLQAEHGSDATSEMMALLVNEENFSAHRGAEEIDDGPDDSYECIVFGNDGFQEDVRSRKEVARLMMRLDQLGIPILGFGVEPEGYSWAMRVECDDEELLDLIVWDIWFDITCPEANPVKEELNDYLGDIGVMAA
ncbi:hypothetical protein KOR42_28580 [Thalassoglobus neptunius]|uniref:Uncharacterized protein n=1 Tax=Thalassoglobus neptunius TaxID=1938619 RepID=A0A5C5WZX3_9PLAN|nr:hypothetical protein [Thalassoglobus neptunius]TWT55472.1 hypothetical protein KOR42_28580 [Thalassoglobus neptunius]